MKPFYRSMMVLTGTLFGVRGADFTTNINAALLYYRAFLIQPDVSIADSDYLYTNT